MATATKTKNHCQQNDPKIQSKLRLATKVFEQYGREIRTIIHSHLNDHSNADDLFQDFFLSLVHKPIPPKATNVKAYLYRAIRNDVLDAARRAKKYRTRIRKYAQHRTCSAAQRNPENILIQAEQAQKMLQIAQQHLPPHEAEALMRRYRHDQNTANAAQTMHISKRSFSRYVCTGLQKVRQFVGEDQKTLGKTSPSKSL
jgi:RNA polymerase sigma factor (sigma-70 family)